jgi:oligogalacturonide lyase
MKIKDLTLFLFFLFLMSAITGQIGTRFPSEKKIIKDPVTGAKLTFLTSKPVGDYKIYPHHPSWTADGNWIIFGSNRVKGEAMAVNEKTGVIIQVSEGGYRGILAVARKSMKLYFLRNTPRESGDLQFGGPVQLIEVDLAKLFADSESGKLNDASGYQRICGTTSASGGNLALDADEEWVYFGVTGEEAAKHLPEGIMEEFKANFGTWKMAAGPTGIGSMNIKTGETKFVVAVPFCIDHIQTNPWVTGEIVFCWTTDAGKAPQRTWTVRADGTGLRPLYPEVDYEWVTHEAIITKDEVAFILSGHVKMGTPDKPDDPKNLWQKTTWGPSATAGTKEKPTGLGIVNLRTGEMTIYGQTSDIFWHVHGSGDGRWAVVDTWERSVCLIDRHSREMILLSTGHKPTAADHVHPSFSPDGTKIMIQSAMLSEDNRSMNICIIDVPKAWLKRKY